MTENAPQPSQEDTSTKQVFGILGTIFGGISLVPFLGIISPLGMLLSVIGLFKDKKKLMAIIGASISAFSIATSPTLWITAACTFDSDGCMVEPIASKTLNTIDDKYGEQINNEINKFGEELQKELEKGRTIENPANSTKIQEF